MDWVKEIKKNENETLKLFYKTYRREVISWLLKNYDIKYEVGADIFQQAVVVFYDKVIQDKLTKESGNIKAYIYSVCKNIAHVYMRKSKKENKFKQEYIYYNIDSNIDSKENIKSEFLQDNLKILHEVLEKIGNPCKRILELFYYYLYKFEEISEELGYKNGNTVKNMKYKCLKRLRSMILDIYKQKK